MLDIIQRDELIADIVVPQAASVPAFCRLHPARTHLICEASRHAAEVVVNDRRQDHIERLHALLVKSVEAVQSSDDWKRLLDFAGRFHRYSMENQTLIAVQHQRAHREGRVAEPVPSYVAGLRTWQALGRCVDKGQRGYAILAPVSYRSRAARQADGSVRPLSQRQEIGNGEDPVRGPNTLRGFTVAYVFDVSQTSGAPLPEQQHPQLLRGQAPSGLHQQLGRFLGERGFTVRDVPDAAAIGGANGLTDFKNRTVSVRADMDPAARVKTLAPETGHVLLHDPKADPELARLGVAHRGRAEVEAESLAYIISSAHGMDTSSYTLPYVTNWAGVTNPADVVRTTAHRVVNAARDILRALDTDHGLGGAPPGTEAALERVHAPRQSRTASLAVDVASTEPATIGV